MSILDHADLRGAVAMSADVVVVGTGPGGAAIGRTLAEGGLRVVFVEEGPGYTRFRSSQAQVMRYHQQEQGMLIARGRHPVAIAAGRGVGGGSLINSAICWRTPDHVLDGWTELLGDDRFRPDAMASIFDELYETLEIVKTPEHIAGENNKMVVRGARALGLEADLLHRNTPRCVGCGVCNFGCPSGGKASVDLNLIPLARAAGAVVYADTRVDRIMVQGGRATGIQGVVRHPDTKEVVGELTIQAKRVVISAGAVGTPRLLHESGVASQLGERVGRGLHLHPGNTVIGLFDHKVEMWKGATQAAYYKDPEMPGVLPHTMSLPPSALLLAMGKVGHEAKEAIPQLPYIGGCLVMISDKGEGTVGASADGRADITYQFAPDDMKNMRRGIQRTAEVLWAAGAKKLMVPVGGTGGRWMSSLDEMVAAVKDIELQDFRALYSAHPMATCRMGKAMETSVVQPSGETHGMPGLYVADSSVFPTPLGVNPQLTTMAIATTMGRGILARV